MQAITQNRITQGQHLASKAVDYDNDPDPIVYAPEDGTIDSYQQRGTPGTTNDAGNALRMNGPTGLHQFAHLEASYVKAGDKVKRGQKLAKMGYTGYTQPDNVPSGAHVHYWVKTPNGYVYPPTLINQSFIKLGEDMIPDQDNWFGRFNKLMYQIRGRNITREEFRKNFVGHPPFKLVEVLSDALEADNATKAQDVGKVAIRDKWADQIASLKAEVARLTAGQTVTQAEIDGLAKKADELEQSIKAVNK